jgi:xanthine dehydrogenase YagS FAD-binding subunit
MASVNLTMDGNRVKAARVVMGAVAPIPWRTEAAEQALAGKTITEAVAADAAAAAVRGATPMTQNSYKVQVARTAVKRAIMRAAGIQTV